MSDRPAFGTEPPTKSERKRARRQVRAESERAGANDMGELTDAAVEAAMALAPEIAADRSHGSRERAVDVDFPTRDAAKHARKRINEALFAAEWLDELEVWLWEADTHVREPLTEHGGRNGYELRIEQRHS
jgi:hypothetical protein